MGLPRAPSLLRVCPRPLDQPGYAGDRVARYGCREIGFSVGEDKELQEILTSVPCEPKAWIIARSDSGGYSDTLRKVKEFEGDATKWGRLRQVHGPTKRARRRVFQRPQPQFKSMYQLGSRSAQWRVSRRRRVGNS